MMASQNEETIQKKKEYLLKSLEDKENKKKGIFTVTVITTTIAIISCKIRRN